MDAALKDNIVTLIYDEYKKLKKSSKPVIRSNGTKEWTVLAGVVAWNTDTDSTKIISLATGVKALPNVALERSSGKMVHDCHAEILALRGFNSVLLQNIAFLKEGKTSEFIKEVNGRFAWHEKNKLILYISKMPCGDASMDSLEESDTSQENYKMKDDDDHQFIDNKIKTIVRGRMNFSRKGIVRTKPGRVDSQITLSKSCSDKLGMKQFISILNCLTFSLFEEPVYLDYLIIPNIAESDIRGLDRCFNSRFRRKEDKESEKTPLQIHPFKIESTDKCFVDDKQSSTEDPSAMSSIKLYYNYSDSTEQAILNGVRNGFFTKGNKRLRKNCESVVSRYYQWNLYHTLFPSCEKSYLIHKSMQENRVELIHRTREKISSDGWIHTFPDDCLL